MADSQDGDILVKQGLGRAAAALLGLALHCRPGLSPHCHCFPHQERLSVEATPAPNIQDQVRFFGGVQEKG